jgi:hypothetical protein
MLCDQRSQAAYDLAGPGTEAAVEGRAMSEKERAEAWAKKNGCTGPVHKVEDPYGGYWQTASQFGPYTFRVKQ